MLRYSPSDLLAWPVSLTEESAGLSARIGIAVAALDDGSLSVLATVADSLVAAMPRKKEGWVKTTKNTVDYDK